jgi:uncharacterized membrane protein (UPF0127 family)
MNDRTRSAVALEVDMAVTRAARRRGLLGRDSLGPTEGLLLSPCKAVHTVGMRFAIDVVFIDGDGRTVRVVPALPPWRIAMSARAKAVIELAAGTAKTSDIQVGDLLYLAPAPPPKRTAPVTPDVSRKPDASRTTEVPLTADVSRTSQAPIEEQPRC